MTTNDTTELTGGQKAVLGAATVPMVAAGGLGAWGTYTNIVSEFGRAATALGVVAAGEGVTLVLALVMVGLTMLGQSAPLPVRVGLWGAPLAAAVTGLVVADTGTEAVVYAMTPMAMCASAEGLGLLARRIVVHRTGVDMEVQRRNAETVQRLAYHRARAANHPSSRARWLSERASWRLAKRVGVGDAQLGEHLVQVQRARLTEGADAALTDMLGVATVPALPAPEVTVERADLGNVVTEVDQAPGEPEVVPDGPSKYQTGIKYGFDHTRQRQVPLEAAERRQLGRADDYQPEAAPKPARGVVDPYDSRVPDFTVGAYWEGDPVLDPKPSAVPAEQPRQVVTEAVALTPSELRRKARSIDRQAVKSTGRRVTIERLRTDLGLSRRDATELRREIVEEDRS